MKITTLVQNGMSAPLTFEWEGDDYHDEPYGEAIAVLLNDDPHMTNNWKVVVHAKSGDVLTYRRAYDAAK